MSATEKEKKENRGTDHDTLRSSYFPKKIPRFSGRCLTDPGEPDIGLITADCLDLHSRDIGMFDTLVTSPPYKIGVIYDGTNEREMTNDEYTEFTRSWAVAVLPHMNQASVIWINIGENSGTRGRATDVARVFEKLGYTWQHTVIWQYSGPGTATQTMWQPNRLRRSYEFILVLVRDRYKLDTSADYVAVARSEAARNRWRFKTNNRTAPAYDIWNGSNVPVPDSDIWEMEYRHFNKTSCKVHPASFPLELPLRCIAISGAEKRRLRVLDPFSGIGTTASAALLMGCDAVGVEISDYYTKVGKRIVTIARDIRKSLVPRAGIENYLGSP